MPSRLHEQLQTALGPVYTVDQELGGGGMSRVFAAEEHALGRKVVVKVLPPELSSEVSLERFRREIQLAARLQHPHVVPLLSAGEVDGLLYYTMPLVEGESLESRLARGGALSPADAIRVLRDVADALAYAHRRGVVHRDVKPANVLLSAGHALVTDFGVAKALGAASEASGPGTLTGIGVALGTPSYMAPEQATADPNVDHRADIYALGVLAYEMLAGKPPFRGASPHEVIAAHVVERPERIESRRPDAPPALAALVMCCLEKRPADRPQSADDVLREIEALAPSAPVQAVGQPAFRRRVQRRATTYAAALLAVGLASYAATRGGPDGAGGDTGAAVPDARTGAGAVAAPSIAVLPFANTSREPETEYFSDGMTEELINALGKIEGLRVISRTSAFALKGQGLDVREISRRLGVAAVVEGSVQRSSDRLRVAAQLVDARTGYQLWSDRFDRRFEDVFAVQDEISRAIASALSVRFVRSTSGAVGKPHPARVEAYDLYLQGRYQFLGYLRSLQEDRLRSALAFFERAVEQDSSFAPAYVGIAEAYGWLADDFLPPDEANASQRPAITRALALDSTLADAYVVLAAMQWNYDRERSRAENSFRRAIALHPNSSWARLLYAWFLTARGRSEEAIREARLARELDPLSNWASYILAGAYSAAGDQARATEQFRFMLGLDSADATARLELGRRNLWQGRFGDAISELEKGVGISKGQSRMLATLGHAYAVAGRERDARRVLAELEEMSRKRYVAPDLLATVHIGLGEKDRAFALLEEAFRVRSAYLEWLKLEPTYDPVRSDPRFKRLLRRMGLE